MLNMHEDGGGDFEALAKQSWQSFSTMKRFVSEANRLENASWRLWFMQRNRPHDDAAAAHRQHHGHDHQRDGAGPDDDDDVGGERVACVYCEMHAASLSCHGCCHDAYCVSCFKLIHKKGHLATHTAVKIETLSLRERERLAAAGLVAHADDCQDHHHGLDQHDQHDQHDDADVDVDADADADADSSSGGGALSPPRVLSPRPPSPPHMSPDQSRHAVVPRDKSTRGGGGGGGGLKAKSWEFQMDMLLQRLMANSLHGDNDISVHNIDSRRSLSGAESLASFLSDTSTSEDAAPPLPPHDDDDGATAAAATKSRSSSMSLSLSSSVESLVAGTAKVTSAALPSAPLGAVDELSKHKTSLSVDVKPSGIGGHATYAYPTATRTPSSSASPAMEPAVVPDTDTLESLDGLSSSLFPSTLAKTKSRKKNSVCANCNGNHITIDCPLLENTIGAGSASAHASGAAGGGGGGGSGSVDTVLRKCFTTIHNDNLSNSTHAFLGDEVSVRGGGNFTKGQFAATRGAWSSFGMNSISEDQTADAEDSLPVLARLPDGESARHWDSATWMVSSLATELPADVFEALRRADKLGSAQDGDGMSSRAGWVHVKKPGSKWCKRFLCLYRNNLWEYLDDKESSRPIGYVNLAEGSVHVHQNTQVEFAFRYFRYSSPDSPRDECWLQSESPQDATRWRETLAQAARLQPEDLFDMRPDAQTSSTSSDAGYELGKGRFATVRRARRRRPGQQHEVPEDCCALKIIDKRVFWDLVAHETERDDTVIREILTQTVLTVRAGAAYCPVIRLLSLFETRSLLVMELELMREGDLHEEIVTKSAVNESTASFLVASLVQAIHFCLQNGVAHRDVKLSNLALDKSTCPKGRTLSVIKLADFGMAAFIQADGLLKGRCGTPGFVAPEILTAGKGEAYPSGVDMFSVGVVAYTMLCGYEPFFGVNDEELIQMNKAVEYEFEEPEWSSISDEAKDLISLMMEKDTTRRITPLEALQHPFLIDAGYALAEATAALDAPDGATPQPPLPSLRLL